MTEEEKTYFDELNNSYFNNIPTKVQKRINKIALYEISENNIDESSKKAAQEELKTYQDDYYEKVILEFERKYGGLPVYVSQLQPFDEEAINW